MFGLKIIFLALLLWSCGDSTSFSGSGEQKTKARSSVDAGDIKKAGRPKPPKDKKDNEQEEPKLVSLIIVPAAVTIPLGTSVDLKAIGEFSDGRNEDLTPVAKWSVEASEFAAGQFKASVIGDAKVLAEVDKLTASAVVTVTAAKLVKLTVEISKADIPVGLTEQAKAFAEYSDGTKSEVTGLSEWQSGNMSTASVQDDPTQKGLVRGVAQGSTQISATFLTLKNNVTVNITPPILVSLTLSPLNPFIYVGEKKGFHLTRNLSDGSSVEVTNNAIWESSMPAIATLNTTPTLFGVFNGNAVGTVEVAAKYTYLGQSRELKTMLQIKPLKDKCLDVAAAKGSESFVRHFASSPNSCEWNLNGNLAPLSGHLQGRRDEFMSVNLTHTGVTCSADLTTSSGEFSYDDVLFFSMGTSASSSYIFATNSIPAAALQYYGLETYFGSGIFLYDWAKIRGSFPAELPKGKYCAGASCVIPPSETIGMLNMQTSASWFQKLPIDTYSQKSFVIGMTVMGDNDATDCRHTPVNLNINFKYVTPSSAIQ